MSYCTKCGQEINSGAPFCPYCGCSVNADAPKKFNLFTAYAEMFKKYADFSGRSTRSEFWYAYLMDFIIASVFTIICVAMFIFAFATENDGLIIVIELAFFLIILYMLATMIPRIALHIRRLHDTGKSGWFYMLSLIPDVGTIVVLVLCALEPQAGANKYGPDPRYN